MNDERDRVRFSQLIPRVVEKASMSNKGGVRGERIEVSVKGTSEVPPFQIRFPLQ
jgi:hypothetical protein